MRDLRRIHILHIYHTDRQQTVFCKYHIYQMGSSSPLKAMGRDGLLDIGQREGRRLSGESIGDVVVLHSIAIGCLAYDIIIKG